MIWQTPSSRICVHYHCLQPTICSRQPGKNRSACTTVSNLIELQNPLATHPSLHTYGLRGARVHNPAQPISVPHLQRSLESSLNAQTQALQESLSDLPVSFLQPRSPASSSGPQLALQESRRASSRIQLRL